MKNKYFDIAIDCDTGCIKSISHPEDEYHMNWCSSDGYWGKIYSMNRLRFEDEFKNVELTSFSADDDKSNSVYSNDVLSVTVHRFFKENGNFSEKYIIKNLTNTVVCVNREKFGIELPFNDRYTNADECITNHCNTHIWCGHNTAWVNALRMGPSDINLGLVLTKGALDSYGQNNCWSNTRGIFIINPSTFFLSAGDTYEIEWELFWHNGTEDFWEKLSDFRNSILINADNYTFFEGETIEFEVLMNNTPDFNKIKVVCKEEELSIPQKDNIAKVRYLPESTGDYRFYIYYNDNLYTYADFTVKTSFEKLVENRVKFIVNNQQYSDKNSPLYGAYLIYDNQTESMYFDDSFPDHNACRERTGMALLLTKYLQFKYDEKIMNSLKLYLEFAEREFYDSKSGEIYNTIGKNRNMIRLYNAPWIIMLFTEVYYLTADTAYLKKILKIAENYYELGGSKFYPNGLTIERLVNAYYKENMPAEAQIIKAFFKVHTDNMIQNGVSYPKHEVNYEQTIVTPAATFISEYGLVSDNPNFYATEAYKHILCLERFSGMQPSFHLNEIPIRYWDDYWFGKNQLHGDTFPHYWSCLTARSYIAYYKLCGTKEYLKKAETCIRNCMCLFTDDGRGSCAYVYPCRLDGIKGEFYDEWANDQDFALYFALSFADELEVFNIK